MSILSFPSQSAITNAASTYSPFQGAGMDGSNQQISDAQQGNRTVTQGDQAPDSSGGTGAVTGGAAGPGGGPAGAAGAARGAAGGTNGAAGGTPTGGQESGRPRPDDPDPTKRSRRESKDNVTNDIVIAIHSGTGLVTSDMHDYALFVSSKTATKTSETKFGQTCETCNS